MPAWSAGRAGEDLLHGDAVAAVVADLVLDARAQVGHVDAQEAGIGALVDARVLLERGDDVANGVRGNREADALRVGRLDGRLVHADDLAVDVDQRAAGVAGVDRSRGLKQTLEVDLRAVFGRRSARSG